MQISCHDVLLLKIFLAIARPKINFIELQHKSNEEKEWINKNKIGGGKDARIRK